MKRTPFKSRGRPLSAKTRIKPVSAKKKAHKAAEKAQGAWEHMAAVKALPCCACGAPPPSQAHHVTGDGKPRSDWRVIPLCEPCHQGPNGYHLSKRSWVARHGPDCGFLPDVRADLGGQGGDSSMISIGDTVIFRPHPGAHEMAGRVVGRTYEKHPRYTVDVGGKIYETKEVKSL